VLALAGYLFGQNHDLLMANIHRISIALLLFCACLVGGYVLIILLKRLLWRKRRKTVTPSRATSREE
jgi:hypothetical protein